MEVDRQETMSEGLERLAGESIGVLRRACALLQHPSGRAGLGETCGGMDEIVLGLDRLADALGRVVAVPSGLGPRVELRLLGEMRVRVDGRVLNRWRSPTGRALLARLALADDRRASLDELLADIWPDAPFARARNRVHVAMHKLRRVVGPGVVEFDGSGYQLAGPEIVGVDVDDVVAAIREGRRLADLDRTTVAVEVLRAAVDGVAGPLCADLVGAEWLDRYRRHVGWRIGDGLHLLGELGLEAREVGLARRAAEQALRTDHADEVAHRILIRCHLAGGRDDLAREQLRRCEDALSQELGLSPLPETVALIGGPGPVLGRAS